MILWIEKRYVIGTKTQEINLLSGSYKIQEILGVYYNNNDLEVTQVCNYKTMLVCENH